MLKSYLTKRTTIFTIKKTKEFKRFLLTLTGG